jgi:hypothetical protein
MNTPEAAKPELSALFDDCVEEVRMQCKEQDQMVAGWFNAAQCKLLSDIGAQYVTSFFPSILFLRFGSSYQQILRAKEDLMLLPVWMFDSSKGLSIYTNEHPAALIRYCSVIEDSFTRLLARQGFDAYVSHIANGNVFFYEVVIKFPVSSSHTTSLRGHRHPTMVGIDQLLTASNCSSFPCTVHNTIQPQLQPHTPIEENDGAHTQENNLSESEPEPDIDHSDQWSEGGDSGAQDYLSASEELRELEPSLATDDKRPAPVELSIVDHLLAIRHIILRRQVPFIQYFDFLVVAVAIGLMYLARAIQVRLDNVLLRLGLFRRSQ